MPVLRGSSGTHAIWREGLLVPRVLELPPLMHFLPPPLHSTGRVRGFLRSEDVVIVVTGWRPGAGYTNIMRVQQVS